MMKKRLLSIAMALALCLGLLPAFPAAAAADPEGLQVVADRNASFSKSGPNWSWDVQNSDTSNGTLTLTNYHGGPITISSTPAADVAVVLVGENSITASGQETGNLCFGLRLLNINSAEIRGSGSLSIQAAPKNDQYRFVNGIYCYNAPAPFNSNLKISSGTSINIDVTVPYASSGGDRLLVCGIGCDRDSVKVGDLTLEEGASLDIAVKSASRNFNYGVLTHGSSSQINGRLNIKNQYIGSSTPTESNNNAFYSYTDAYTAATVGKAAEIRLEVPQGCACGTGWFSIAAAGNQRANELLVNTGDSRGALYRSDTCRLWAQDDRLLNPFTYWKVDPYTGKNTSAPKLLENLDGRVALEAQSIPGQTVEYAVSKTAAVPADGWQTDTVFSNLTPGETYWFFARVRETDRINAGTAASVSAVIKAPTITDVAEISVDLLNYRVGVDASKVEVLSAHPEQYTVTMKPLPAGPLTGTTNLLSFTVQLQEGFRFPKLPTATVNGQAATVTDYRETIDARFWINLAPQKKTPVCIPPEGLTAFCGQTLKDIDFPENSAGNTPGHWYWMDNSTSVGDTPGVRSFPAQFSPESQDYETIKNIPVKVTVKNAPVAPTLTTTELPHAIAGKPYSFTFTATGTGPFTWESIYDLPEGLTLNAATGVLSGTPTTTETRSMTISVSNAAGSDNKMLELRIYGQAKLLDESLPAGTTGQSYNKELEAENTTDFVLSKGALPDGLAIDNPYRRIAGMPTALGDFTFTLTAENRKNGEVVSSHSREYTLHIGGRLPMPTLDPPGASELLSLDSPITVSCDAPAFVSPMLYYTIDDTDPRISPTRKLVSGGSIYLTKDMFDESSRCVLRVIAESGLSDAAEQNYLPSEEQSTYYRLATAPDAPTASLGAHDSTVTICSGTPVSLRTATANATIFYTLDGSDPTTSKTRRAYTDPLPITDKAPGFLAVTAVSTSKGFRYSDVRTFRYELVPFAAIEAVSADGLTIHPHKSCSYIVQVIAAGYDEQGRLVALAQKQLYMSNIDQSVTIPAAGFDKAHTVRLFAESKNAPYYSFVERGPL